MVRETDSSVSALLTARWSGTDLVVLCRSGENKLLFYGRVVYSVLAVSVGETAVVC